MKRERSPVSLRIFTIFCLTSAVCGCSHDSATMADSSRINGADSLTLSSPDVAQGGTLPVDYTCDGTAATLPLKWSGAPHGTVSYALIMHHEASPTDIHWYWVVYNIPPETDSIPRNGTGPWTLGNNSVNGLTEYAPPCSKGPGPKTYIYTLYALSATPTVTVDSSLVTRDVLLSAIDGLVLDSARLVVTYTRP